MKTIKHIEIVPYNPAWPVMFETESIKLKNALGDNCIAIHHIGSTSVPGLAAKPKIDILGIVKELKKTIEALAPLGYQYRGEYNIPMHYGFSKRGDIDFNLHIYQEDHPECELNLLFRDYLRTHPTACDAYANLKYDLIKDTGSFEINNPFFTEYTLRKGDFIRKILKEAGYNRLRFLKCSDHTEWDAAKNFRQKYFFDNVPISDPYTWTFNHPDHVHFVLYQGADIIGYAHIQLWPEKRAAIRIIVVDDTKRNQGFGGEFLKLIEEWLQSQDYKSVHTESSPNAVPFYKKHGYSEMPFNDPDGYESSPLDVPLGKTL